MVLFFSLRWQSAAVDHTNDVKVVISPNISTLQSQLHEWTYALFTNRYFLKIKFDELCKRYNFVRFNAVCRTCG